MAAAVPEIMDMSSKTIILPILYLFETCSIALKEQYVLKLFHSQGGHFLSERK
jgi:hypothetical protein